MVTKIESFIYYQNQYFYMVTTRSYLSGIKVERQNAERLFKKADSLIGRTEKLLDNARTEFTQYQNVLDSVSYVGGVDSPEIGVELKTSRVGLKFYTKRVEQLERQLEDYKQAKMEAEDDWKKYNGEMKRAHVMRLSRKEHTITNTPIDNNYTFTFDFSEAPTKLKV